MWPNAGGDIYLFPQRGLRVLGHPRHVLHVRLGDDGARLVVLAAAAREGGQLQSHHDDDLWRRQLGQFGGELKF